MNTQPTALRLAELLDSVKRTDKSPIAKTADELRRLHQQEMANAIWLEKTNWVRTADIPTEELGMHRADVIKQRFDRLHALNQELLEALKELVAQNETSMFAVQISGASLSNARAAIAKAGEQK